MPISIIKQLGIYANRIYVHDLLAELAVNWENFTPPMVIKYPSLADRIAYNRLRLVNKIEEILALQPLAQAGIVYFIPTELIQPKREIGGVYADDLFGPTGAFVANQLALPRGLKEYCEQNIRVFPAKYIDDEPVVLNSQELSPTRMIAVRFSGDPVEKFFQLQNISVGEDSDNTDRYRFTSYFNIETPDPVDPNTFAHWVKGSKDKVIEERIAGLEHDLSIATLAKAKFLTPLSVTRDIALLNIDIVTPKVKTTK